MGRSAGRARSIDGATRRMISLRAGYRVRDTQTTRALFTNSSINSFQQKQSCGITVNCHRTPGRPITMCARRSSPPSVGIGC
jgi:hypothetical protein